MLSQIEIPEFDKYMYLKGYTPEQIIMANRKRMYDEIFKDDDEITIKVEIKK